MSEDWIADAEAKGPVTHVPASALIERPLWGLRAFPLRRSDVDPTIWTAIVPGRLDVAGVRRGTRGRLEVTALVRLLDSGDLADTSRAEVEVAVLGVGDQLPGRIDGTPRLLGQVEAIQNTGVFFTDPEAYRPSWAYLLGAAQLPGGAAVYAEQFEVVPS